MNNHAFTLDDQRPTRKFICPGCGKRELKRYQQTSSGELFHNEKVGRCNRAINCGYHYPPKQYFIDHPTLDTGQGLYRACPVSNVSKSKTDEFSTIPLSVYEASRRGYSNNCFVLYLRRIFGNDLTEQLLNRFAIGTAKKWPGATVFWQIDEIGNVRAGKIMLYNMETGKRVKKPFNHVQWVHSVMNIPDFQLQQCLFGLHQIRVYSNNNPVCIVESEKTAILMTAVLPGFLWLATGGLHNLNPEKCAALKKYKIRLYPDLGCYLLWLEKAKEMGKAGFEVQVSDLLERFAVKEDHVAGYDLADYFIRPDKGYGWALSDKGYPLLWDH